MSLEFLSHGQKLLLLLKVCSLRIRSYFKWQSKEQRKRRDRVKRGSLPSEIPVQHFRCVPPPRIIACSVADKVP